MFENALLAVNWSGTGVDAAAFARSLCIEDATLTLAHVHAEVPLSPDALVMELRRFELRHSMRALRGLAYATNIEPTLSVGAPSVSEGLSGLVSMIGADLLVLGPVDWRLPAGVELADWLMHRPSGAPAAVAIAQEGFADDGAPLSRIGVVCDDSRMSLHRLAAAQHLAGALGSRLKVFEASPAGAGPPGPRRRAITAQRLAEFSSRVDLLVSSAGEPSLVQGAQSPLLLINHAAPLRSAGFDTATAPLGRSL